MLPLRPKILWYIALIAGFMIATLAHAAGQDADVTHAQVVQSPSSQQSKPDNPTQGPDAGPEFTYGNEQNATGSPPKDAKVTDGNIIGTQGSNVK